MKLKLTCLFFMILTFNNVFAQLSIDQCYEKAHKNYPLISQYDLISQLSEYNISNIGKGYLPQISLSVKANYQSEVTEIPISMPGINPISKDQYSAVVEVNQTIWDGGVIRSKKEGLRIESEVENRGLDVNIYALNERVNQLYFGILLFDLQLKQNQLYREELQRNYDKVYSYMLNGIANQADIDAIKVEQLKAIQTQNTLNYSRKAYVEMLSVLIGDTITDHTVLDKPKTIINNNSIFRPELDLFDAQIKNIEVQNRQITAQLMPKIGVFFTGGYGRPGLNMLKNNLSGYYVAGARLTWNFGAFYTYKNNRHLLKTNIKLVEVNRDVFLFNTNIDISKRRNEIDKFREQLKYDDQIIELRTSIKESSEIKMANGTISGVDFMRDVTSEQSAKQDKIYHEIEMLLAMYNLKYVTNN